jgi:hypothetical protein
VPLRVAELPAGPVAVPLVEHEPPEHVVLPPVVTELPLGPVVLPWRAQVAPVEPLVQDTSPLDVAVLPRGPVTEPSREAALAGWIARANRLAAMAAAVNGFMAVSRWG